MAKKRERSSGRVLLGGGVIDERVSSNGCVVRACSVEQKRCSAHCGIGIRVVEGQRSAANTSVEAAGAIQEKRTPTQCCISSAGGEQTKRVAPFGSCEIGIAPFQCRTDCLHLWQKPGEQERDYNDNGLNSGFHMREVFEEFLQPVENNLRSSTVAGSVGQLSVGGWGA